MSFELATRVGVLTAAVAAAACSSSDTHPPVASNDCSSNCDHGVYGGHGQATSTGGADGGATTLVDGATAGPSGCVADPTFGFTLCATAPSLCPGVTIDLEQLSGIQVCGFTTESGRAPGFPDVECLCPNGFLCPLSPVANCATIPNLVAQQATSPVCSTMGNTMGTTTCIDLSTLPPKSDGGTCNQSCLQTCGNAPVCVTLCNC